MTTISFLAIFTAQIFENCFSISRGKKLQYELYSEQGANQEDNGQANITNLQQRTQCSQCRIGQDMISMRTCLNPTVNMFSLVSGDLHAKCKRKVIFHRTDKMEMKNTILKEEKMGQNSMDNRMQRPMEIQEIQGKKTN